MKIDVIVPQMGESVTEATILKWHKNVGDQIEKDETLLEISTDKVDTEIPSPASGLLAEITAKNGDVVPVKTVIAVIETAAAAPAKSAPAKAATEATSQEAKVAPPSPPPAAAPPKPPGASPLAQNVAQQKSVTAEELSQIPGSGAQGRITKSDVVAYVEQREKAAGPPAAQTAQAPAAASPVEQPASGGEGVSPMASPTSVEFGEYDTVVVPMDHIRKRIAEHMVRSKATSPHTYTVAEADVYNLARWRERNQSAFLSRAGFKLSFTPCFLEAAAKALQQFPYVNASIEGENIILKRRINIGCAVALENAGLLVPVIQNADQLSVTGLARALHDLASRARSRKLLPQETQNGTFTVTNPGTFGNIIGFPIINQPQAAILSLGAIKKQPVVVNDMIAIREMVYLTLSYDHRLIDGSTAGRFMQFIVKYLENWEIEREVF